MGFPINIDSLINGEAIEWERLEFKRGWNPEDIIHTICAFANDMSNWGGGYIVVGVEENNGQPILPPFGIPQSQLDDIQGEILKLAYQISPNYFPLVQPYALEGKHILVIWCPAGDNRPYSAPSTQGSGAQRHPYIRFASRSIIAKNDNLRRLNELTARIPFDDRINTQATINDFDLGLIQAFLQEVKSDLYEESKHISLTDLARNMHIAKGPNEAFYPANVGLLFFTQHPDRFISRCWIELVWHKDNTGANYSEHYFKGALHVQLRDTLAFIQNNIISEEVRKVPNQAEAIRFYNYPYDALEEALANAVYHKSYELNSPIEIQIWPDKIEILSFPGPVPPVDAAILKSQRRIVARDYRNRRIGDFLKELRLTEGRGTGLPTIYDAMDRNGSPSPTFETDEQATHFLVTLPVHPLVSTAKAKVTDGKEYSIVFNDVNDVVVFVNDTNNDVASDQVSDQARDQAKAILEGVIHERVIEVLALAEKVSKRDDILKALDLSSHTSNRKRYIEPLEENGWIEKTEPDKPTTPNQKYKLTKVGKRLLGLVRK